MFHTYFWLFQNDADMQNLILYFAPPPLFQLETRKPPKIIWPTHEGITFRLYLHTQNFYNLICFWKCCTKMLFCRQTEHTPGQVCAKILINGKSVGARHFTYQSSVLTNSVLGVTQIYVHQLCTVLDALEKLGGGGAGKDRRGSGTGARAVSAEVDNELSRIFSDCEELNIPLQAFEQIFGAYRYITAG